MIDLSKIKGNIKAELSHRNMTIGDLATITGISKSQFSRRFANPGLWTVGEIGEVCHALNLPNGDIIHGRSENH